MPVTVAKERLFFPSSPSRWPLQRAQLMGARKGVLHALLRLSDELGQGWSGGRVVQLSQLPLSVAGRRRSRRVVCKQRNATLVVKREIAEYEES